MAVIRITPRDRPRRERRAVALALAPAVVSGALGAAATADPSLGGGALAVASVFGPALFAWLRGPERFAGVAPDAAPRWFAYLPSASAGLAALTGLAIGGGRAAIPDGPEAPLWLVLVVSGCLAIGLFRPRPRSRPRPEQPPTRTSGPVIRIGRSATAPPAPVPDFDDDFDDFDEDDFDSPPGASGGLTIRSPQRTTCAGCKQPITAREPVSYCSGSARHKVHTECANVLCNNKCPECGHRVN